MASMPIHHETAYLLTDDMPQYIIRDAQEHFGEQVRAIRVQTGLARQAFNARTREVRYAFSPMAFGVVETTPPLLETSASAVDLPDRDDDLEEARLAALFDDVDTETAQPRTTSLASLEEAGDEAEDDDVFTLDDPVEDADEDEDEDDSAVDSDDEEE
jgi:hypothetical protein